MFQICESCNLRLQQKYRCRIQFLELTNQNFTKVLAKPGFGEDVREIKRLPVIEQIEKRSEKLSKIANLLDNSLLDRIWSPESKVRGTKWTSILVDEDLFPEVGVILTLSFQDLYSKVWSEFEEKLEEKFKKVRTIDKQDPAASSENSLTVRIPTETACSTGLTSPILAQSSGFHGLAFQHILGVDMFNKDQLNELFNIAQSFRIDVMKQRSLDHVLKASRHV